MGSVRWDHIRGVLTTAGAEVMGEPELGLVGWGIADLLTYSLRVLDRDDLARSSPSPIAIRDLRPAGIKTRDRSSLVLHRAPPLTDPRIMML